MSHMTLFLRLFVRVEHSQALRQDAQELAHVHTLFD